MRYLLILAGCLALYGNHFKNPEFGAECSQHLHSAQVNLVQGQGVSENANFEISPTLPKNEEAVPQVCSEEAFEEEQVEAAAPPLEEEGQESALAEEACPSPWVRWARCLPEKRWYFEFKPGYYYFTDSQMRSFFDNGGFTIRAETGYQFWGPLMVWVDASYFQKSGSAIGGTEPLEIKLASITLGLKAFHQFNSYVAAYVGAGPRLLMMLLHNGSPFVRGEDNEVGIGGGFNAGLWLFPIPQWWPSLFVDLFTDYSLKTMHVQPDEISSIDHDVDISGFTFGLGLGIRF